MSGGTHENGHVQSCPIMNPFSVPRERGWGGTSTPPGEETRRGVTKQMEIYVILQMSWYIYGLYGTTHRRARTCTRYYPQTEKIGYSPKSPRINSKRNPLTNANRGAWLGVWVCVFVIW